MHRHSSGRIFTNLLDNGKNLSLNMVLLSLYTCLLSRLASYCGQHEQLHLYTNYLANKKLHIVKVYLRNTETLMKNME